VWSHFSVKVQELQARAFFIKYGCDTEGMLPYEVCLRCVPTCLMCR
jgi:hypothetical protein